MDEMFFDDFDVEIDPSEYLFVISVVSEMVNIPLWTLRKLDEMDIVKPRRVGKKTRCYCKSQIKQLNYIHYLMHDKGVNISGIKFIIELEQGKGQDDEQND